MLFGKLVDFVEQQNFLVKILVLLFGLSYAISVTFDVKTECARKALDNQPKILNNYLPMGFDRALQGLYYLSTHGFYEWFQKLLASTGRTFEMHIMGQQLIMTDEPENIRAIMSTQFGEFGKGELVHGIWDGLLGASVFATDGNAWNKNKDQLKPHLARSRPDDLERTEQHFQNLLKTFDQGGAVDVYDLIDRFQLDVVSDIFLSVSTNSLFTGTSPIRSAIDTLLRLNCFRQLLGKPGLYLSEYWLCPGAVRDLNKFLDQSVDYTLSLPLDTIESKPESDRSLVESLALQRLDSRNIKNQVIAVLLAGKDPTAIVVSWAIYELAQNPDILSKLKHAISVMTDGSNRPLNLQEMRQLPLLRNIVNETMRLYHPLGFNLKIANRDTSLPRGGGQFGDMPIGILKDTQVLYSVFSLQRRKEACGADAEKWVPDRWAGKWKPDLWEFIPFNNGPRMCLGRVFGQIQCEYAISRIAQEFRSIELVAGERQRIKFELNTKMAYPILCKFNKH